MFPADSFQTIFKFTEDDLSINREGKLSPAQIGKVRRSNRTSGLLIGGFFAIFFVMLSVMLAGFSSAFSSSDTLQIGFLIPVIIVGVLWLIFGVIVLFSLRSAFFSKIPTVNRISGTVVSGNRTSSDQLEFEVNGQQFFCPGTTANLFDPTKTYTFYYTSASDIWSIEEQLSGSHSAFASSSLSSSDSEKSPLDYEMDQLRSLYHFTAADLAINRTGKMSAEQVSRLKKDTRGTEIGCLLLSIPIALFPSIYIWGFFQQWLIGGVVALAIFGLLTYMNINSARKQSRELTKGKVKATSGTAEVKITTEHVGGEHPHTDTIYHVTVGGTHFRVAEKEYLAFKEGKQYAIYYAPAISDQIVSAEQIG